MSPAQTLSFKRSSAAPAWLLVAGLHLLLWFAIRPGFVRHDNEEATRMELSWISLQAARPPVKPEAKPDATPERPQPVATPAARKPPKSAVTPAPVTITPSSPATTSHEAPVTTAAPAQSTPAASDDFLTAKPVNGDRKLDLDALHSSAGKIDRQDPIARVQAQYRRDDTLETRLGEKAKKAQKKDCRTAYAGLGLLAVVPLAFSAVSDKDCKW